jgi:hypothetical protein
MSAASHSQSHSQSLYSVYNAALFLSLPRRPEVRDLMIEIPLRRRCGTFEHLEDRILLAADVQI